MKKSFITICVITMMILTISGTTQAIPTTLVQVENLPSQDLLEIPLDVHELGMGDNFPQNENIVVWIEEFDVQYTPCLENLDDPSIPNPLVLMGNTGTWKWFDVWYVGDATESGFETFFQNYDGIVNGGVAFKIDNIGLNKPLVFESITADNIFEPGEVWAFVIQDYQNIYGLSPDYMLSPGVGAFSAGDQISSGSIIAIPAPGAILLGGIGVSLVGWLRRRRTL